MATSAGAPANFVPVDRRFLGLDKRTILPSIGILILVMIWSGVLPAINDAISYTDEVKAGDVITLGAGITYAPAVGWGIEKGTVVGQEPRSGVVSPTSTVVNAGVTFTVERAPFTGTPNQLLNRINKTSSLIRDNADFRATSARATITTSNGEDGVAEKVLGSHSAGILAAFVFGTQGVKVTAQGPPGTVRDQVKDVARMIDSLDFTPGATK